jgi:hypothetical protein
VLIQGRLQIHPNFQAVKPKITLSIPKFEKMKRRDLTFLKNGSEAPDWYDATSIERGINM